MVDFEVLSTRSWILLVFLDITEGIMGLMKCCILLTRMFMRQY